MDNQHQIFLQSDHDFIGLIRLHCEKLSDKNIITLLWDQLTKKESPGLHDDKLTEYRDHLPVDLHKYVKILEFKCSKLPSENLQLLDGTHKTYLITFLFFCTKPNSTVTDKTKLTASILYLNLTILPEVGKLFFNKSMYMCQLSTAVNLMRSRDISNDRKETIIKLVKRHCLQEEHLDSEMLGASANVIVVSMIIGASEKMIRCGTVTDLAACCMKALRIIILHTSSRNLVKIIARTLFRCIKKKYLDLIPNCELAVDIIILFLKGTLQIKAFERKIDSFLDGFGDNWASEEPINFKDTVKIMNILPEEHYKTLLRRMITLTAPKNKKTLLINVFFLIREILTVPPNFALEKITVLYSCTVGNVLHHILNSEEQVVSSAIDVFKDISDAATNPLHQYIFAEVRATRKLVNMPIESVLLGLSRAANQTWSPRNRKLFQIFSRFVAVTPNLNPIMVEKALDGIIKDANPKTFDGLLETLQVSYLAASERGEIHIAEMLLRVVHKFAVYPNDKFYFMYANHIFNGMLKPSVVYGKTYSPKYYYRIYLTSSFDYEALFTKCNNLIRDREVHLAIKNLDYKEPCSGILLCCLLEHCLYMDISTLVPYVIDNFSNLSGHMTVGYVCTALETILKNRVVSDLTHPQLDVIQSAIMSGLFERNFPVQCIKPIFSLYRTIRRILSLPDNEDQLNELLSHTARKMLRRLLDRNFDDNNSILYLNEICLILNNIPSDAILLILKNCLDNAARMSVITTYMPDIYVQTLTLLCTIAMVNKSKVSIPLKYLQQSLNSGDCVMKVVTIKLLYSLCREITHEFNVVIKFSFKEMVTGNPCLVRICASILEELIHEDYIKLTTEDFFRFIYILGCNDLRSFMKELLLKRFVLSNQNDITKFYLPIIMYVNMYGKFSHYPISSTFYGDLEIIRSKINSSTEMFEFLFLQLPIHKKFNILMEISSVFEDLIKGQCKVDDNFFNVLLDLIATIKLMKTSVTEKQTPKHYYQNIIKQVEKQIIRFDPNYKKEEYYKEFENEIKRCTLALLKLLFFENEQLASKIQIHLFDALIHWIDFIKAEIIHYIHQERGKDYDPYFAKLVQFYRKNKNIFDTLSSQLSGVSSYYVDEKPIFVLLPLTYLNINLV
ncbi:uncharacterized protein LOC108907335 [Anoplophora glabripennis]|uniref:uncharacterized protein LOC108907335 n=1 Tax=Anoplophora glabripennis TaxID=217634 RepID=UPI00087492E3|nr:uncharacterized protein LOC108907335 [Anoplophora glabripennis]